MSKALVLVGHGSARNPNTRLPVCANVQEIKRRGLYDEIRCGLLKEEPHVSITLDKLKSGEVTVVPMFISDGYYSKVVIPKEMGVSGALSDVDGRKVRYTGAVGSHPLFAELVLSRAREAGWESGDALVVLGHGTPKNPESATNVYLQADRVRQQIPGEECITLFIDEPPDVLEIWERTEAKKIVMVPLFIANGWHVTETVPEDLGLTDGQKVQNGRTLIMTSACGTDPGLTDVILSLAEEAESQ